MSAGYRLSQTAEVRPTSARAPCFSCRGNADQTFFDPGLERIVLHFATGNARYDIRHCEIVLDNLIAASRHQQLYQIEGGTLVSVHESMVGNNAMNERRCFWWIRRW